LEIIFIERLLLLKLLLLIKTPQKTDPTLERNSVLITEPDAKAGDLALKKEIPAHTINPLEVPTILGKVCTGPHYYGINLESTLRFGRCDTSQDPACYLKDLGLYEIKVLVVSETD
jgi:hypothetical protein